MRWDTGSMIRPQAGGMDAQQRKTIQQLSGTMASSGVPVTPGGTFGSGIQLSPPSASSSALAGFTNLAPQQPGAGWNGGGMPPQTMAGSMGASMPPTMGTAGTPTPTQPLPQTAPGGPGNGMFGAMPTAVNPYAGGGGDTPYSQLAIDMGMNVGDIWSNPKFANAMALQAQAGNGGKPLGSY